MGQRRLTDAAAGPADSRMAAYFNGQHHPQQGTLLLSRGIRHEAGADQAVRQQVGEPRRIMHIGLAAGHVLDVGRIGQDSRSN